MSSRSWKVGVLFSQTGVTAAVERTQRAATLLAIDEINKRGGVGGRPIEPIAYDPGSDPANYREFAKRLCDRDGVRVVFGCHMSSTRKAALPVFEAREALLFYPTLYEGFEYSQHCVYTGAAPNQNSVQLVKYLTSHYGNRVLLIGSNYVYPYESNRVVGDLFRLSGGKVIDEMYVSLRVDEIDFTKAFRQIKAAKPNVIYSSVVGDGIALFYEQYREAGFSPDTMPIASLSTSEAEIAQMAPGVAEGHIVAAPYFGTLATGRSREFVKALKRSAGPDLPVTASAEAAYFQVFLYAGAVERAGSDRLQELLPALYEIEYDAPQGRVKVDRANNHTHLWPRVGKVNERGEFDIVDNPGIRVEPDPFMLEFFVEPSAPRAVELHG